MELEYYEPRFWGLDPVFSARVKLNIIDVISLQPYPTIPGIAYRITKNSKGNNLLLSPLPPLLLTEPEVYCILNHPVQSVHIMGDVVSIHKKSRMVKYDGGLQIFGVVE